MVAPLRAGADPVPARTPRPDVRLDIYGALAATAAAVLAYVAALRLDFLPPSTASVVLMTAAVLAGAVALPVFLVRARSERDDALAWFAVGLATTLIPMTLQLISFPLISPGGGPLGTSNDATALLYLLFHQWILLGAFAGAVGVPGTLRPWFFGVGSAISVIAAVDLLPAPRMFDGDEFTPALVLAEMVYVGMAAVTVFLWLRRVGRVARPLRAWAAVALSLTAYDLLLNVLASQRYDSVWWSSLSMRAATFVVLAVGALLYLLTELARLEHYTDAELGRSEHELRRSLTVTDRLLVTAETLSRAVGPREVAQAVVAASLSLTGLARASVALLDPEAGRLRTIAAVGYDDASLRILRDYGVLAPLPAAVVLRSGEPMYATGQAGLRERFPSWSDLPVHRDTVTLAVLPLRSAGQAVGVLKVSGPLPKEWTAMDREVLSGLAAQAGQALQRALLYERQRSAAAMLQRGLLPDQLPAVPGVGMAARYLPGAEGLEVGGDWYDAIPVSGGRVALVVGDVMGKGVGAATRMGQIRAAVRVLAALDPSPSAVVAGLDAVEGQLDDDQIVTLVYVLLDPASGKARIARVGHLPPLLVHPDRLVETVEAGGCPPLGTPDVERAEASFDVPARGLLVLYTDGLVEDRANGLERGLPALSEACARLCGGVASGSGSLEDMAEDVLLALGHTESARDDVCLLLARLGQSPVETVARPVDHDDVASIRLPADTATPSRARRFVAERLTWHGSRIPEDRFETVLLICSELVTNAVLHADGPIDLTVSQSGGKVRLSVRDTSPKLPVRRELDVASTSGRGMVLVTSLADDWGVEVDDGKTVWAEYGLHPARHATARV